MIDEDDDLFAVRPKPARRPAKRTVSETSAPPQPNPKIEPVCQPAPVPVVSKVEPSIEWRRNPGHLPDDAIGKRVRVKLRNGSIGSEDGGSMVPPGWAADGKGACNWRLKNHPFDIEYYVVL